MKMQAIGEAVRKVPTPFYLLDKDQFRRNIERTREVLGETIFLCYAVKANPFLISTAAKTGIRLEICSPGELDICLDKAVSLEQMVISGVYKEYRDILRTMESEKTAGIYTVESEKQLEQLEKAGKAKGKKLRVLLRLTSGNQFGLDQELIRKMIANRTKYSSVEFAGIQFYSGTQKNFKTIGEELKQLDDFLVDLQRAYQYYAEELEYGPGLPVVYFQKQERQEKDRQLIELRKLLEDMNYKGKITLEMGRFLAAECGCYATRLIEEKMNHGILYGIVDGGIHQVNYYGQTMAMKLPYYIQMNPETGTVRNQGKQKEITVCGALCTVSDVLVKKMPLFDPCQGDVLVFENTGAYSVTEGISLFLSRPLPEVLTYSENEGLRSIRAPYRTSAWNKECDR